MPKGVMLDTPDKTPFLFSQMPDSVSFRKLRKRLLRQTQTVIDDFGLIDRRSISTGAAPRPKWLICLSGGKDSYTLLSVLLDLQWQGALPVDFLACNLDQGQPGFPKHIMPEWLDKVGVPYRIETQDTYSIVTDKVPENKTYCALCSRLRRGILYRIAREEGCEAIVLGHHRDDALETFMLNLLHGGRLAAMPAKLINDAGDVFVHRPLIGCSEDDLQKYSDAMNFPIIPCNLCGSQDGLQRQAMKRLLSEWETKRPGTRQKMATAIGHVRPSHLLDPNLFDFAGLKQGGGNPQPT
jgi:tRNA 2-thiocytidine biosynthesis protein TtcA